jgi:hypothetical protein
MRGGRLPIRLGKRRVALLFAAILLSTIPTLDAAAHIFNVSSKVSLNASRRRVERRQTIILSGKVSSTQPECVQGRQVKLGGTATTTNSRGGYRFVIRPRRTQTYRTSVLAVISGVHPHSHTCRGDTSNGVRVEVRDKDDD